ncbi:MAG: glycoside hydrolase family 16 protein [Candidatus Izimaplasma sp.]|nr:glycoside hydrolase family 16 protein [Candidatus Izimaplasma bacterium]
MKKIIIMLFIFMSSTLIACVNTQTLENTQEETTETQTTETQTTETQSTETPTTGTPTTGVTTEENINKPVFGDMDSLIGYLGESINLFEDVFVIDEEDGDLTEEVTIENLSDLPISDGLLDTTGTFIIQYYVVDTDGNITMKERYLIIYEASIACDIEVEGFILTFCDDFNEAENTNAQGVDMDKWGYQNGDGSEYGIPGWGNNEQQYYREENSYVKNGLLFIEAKLESYGESAYTSSKLVTKDKFSQAFGRFEARIKLPLGDGLWPAFWMMPQDNVYGGWAASGEIDIMEARGRIVNEASGAIHYGGQWPDNIYQHGSHTFPQGEGIDTFHVYAVEWTNTSIKWYFDDILVWEATDWYTEGQDFPAPFDESFYMILNLAVGGHFDDYRLPNSSIFDEPVVMIVDYVRVYQFDE